MGSCFQVCINAVIPTFIIMMVGYFCKTVKLIDRPSVLKFNRVMFRAFLPVMLFYNIYNSDLNHAFNIKMIIYIVVAFFVEVLFSVILSKMFTKERSRRGVMMQGMFRSNTLVVGLPIAMALLGDVDLGPVVVSTVIAVPLFNVMAVSSLEYFSGETTNPGKLIKGILTNPLIIGTLLGVLFVLLKIRIPATILSAVKSISQAASPVLLFLVGAFFSFDRVGSSKKELIVTIVCRLIAFPAVFLSLGALFGFRGVEFVALITVFASSNAVTSATMAQQLGGDADLAGNIVVLTNALCPLTLFMWSFIFKMLGVF